jgi:hypothetical protein
MPVRPFAKDDIPQVAVLYWKVLRERRDAPPAELQFNLDELYFKNPWAKGPQPSLVFEENGRIIGFLGVVRRPMCRNDQPIVTALGGNFAVHPDSRANLAALHLLRTYMTDTQDLSLTDSANDISRALLERLGFQTIVPFSVHWIRVLKPTQFAAFAASRFAANGLVCAALSLARPVCGLLDHLAGKLALGPFRRSESSLHASELDLETFLSCQREFRNGYSLWSQYDADSLTWVLGFMARMKAHGNELRKLVLRDSGGKVVGWYIYLATAGGLGEVVQVGGDRRNIKNILDHLFQDAWNHDVVALRGVVDRHLMPDFSEKNCLFTCRGGWMAAYSRNLELIRMLQDDGTSWSRLDGEWCLAFGN